MRGFVATLLTLLAAWPGEAAEPFRVRLGDFHRPLVEGALAGAARRLSEPGCAAVLDDFAGPAGEPLRVALAALGVAAPEYLTWVVFADGYGAPTCRRSGVYAFTHPGSRVVYVCAERFRELLAGGPERAEAVLIHEMLHSLGLAHDEPASWAITDRVFARCGAGTVARPDHPRGTRPRSAGAGVGSAGS